MAFDATAGRAPTAAAWRRHRPRFTHAGRLALADCATAADAASAAADAGADIVATTLCGYTAETRGRALPRSTWCANSRACAAFCICEGGIRSPPEVRAALDAGADAVVVGTAITNVDWLVREFAGYADRYS